MDKPYEARFHRQYTHTQHKAAFVSQHKEMGSAAAEHLARKMLAERFRISPSVIRLGQMENGQPVAENLPCFVSLSHSGRWAMCALYEHPVGADIEELSSRGQKLTSRICTDKEREYIYSSGDFDPLRFLKLWTAKEASVKRLGEGLSGGLRSRAAAISRETLTGIDGCRLVSGVHEDAVYAVVY